MDFRHLIVTCLFSMLRLSFENQKNKKNYAIFLRNITIFFENIKVFLPTHRATHTVASGHTYIRIELHVRTHEPARIMSLCQAPSYRTR